MNLFIRTNIAPYRVDTYNALSERLGMKMCFYSRVGNDQKHDIDLLESQCSFVPAYLKGISFGRDSRKLCFGLWRMLFKEKPELVIVPEFQISALQVLLYRWVTGARFKVVSMIDDSYDMIANGNDFTRLHGWLRSFFPKHLDDVILVTPEVRDWYKSKYGKGIWMPIIMDEAKAVAYYESLLPKSRELAIKYGLKGKKVLLYVGRLVNLKNLHTVIDAFAETGEDGVLVIVGDGSERAFLECHAKSVNKEIIFTGRFDGDDLFAWYNLASVFILASYLEPFGAVTNEALLAGCRVVISDKAGSACLVGVNNGELVNPEDVHNIAAAIDNQMALSSVPDMILPRKSLMTISFDERIDNLVNCLKTQ